MLFAAKLIEPRRSTGDAVSVEIDGSEASCNDGKKETRPLRRIPWRSPSRR
jgi:hypothetical protein